MSVAYFAKVLKNNFPNLTLQPNSLYFVKDGEMVSAKISNAEGNRTYDIFVSEKNGDSVEGPKTQLTNFPSEFRINDYDVTHSYVVSTLNGTVSIDKDVITYTPDDSGNPCGFTLNDRFFPVTLVESQPKLAWATDMGDPSGTTYDPMNSGEMLPSYDLVPYNDLYFKLLDAGDNSLYDIVTETLNVNSDLETANETNSNPNWTPVYDKVTGMGRIPCVNGTGTIDGFSNYKDSVITIFLVKDNVKLGFLKVVIAGDALENMYGDDPAIFISYSAMQTIDTVVDNQNISLGYRVHDSDSDQSYFGDPNSGVSDEDLLNGPDLYYNRPSWRSTGQYRIRSYNSETYEPLARENMCTRFPFRVADDRTEILPGFTLELVIEGFSTLRDELGEIPYNYISFIFDPETYQGLIKFNLPSGTPTSYGIVRLRPRVGNKVWKGLRIVVSIVSGYDFYYGLLME